ncbi:putative uncharacterized protein [Bifidobacterium animalis subsp. lactis CECT 8145]|uniref:Uncharacterized protein n=2 Tax=Bifidobacterium animalis subsp. lactis TaxID=302911 RepID=B8DU96_BIFA0|nr:hypothetical protein BLA_1288 [Bifidobacterium animalis subsp. lactis AD011]AEK30221.1 hypothetical protein BALAC2494_01703 [Bifidobacterium animalis subsp. lactis CNCM I-2494]QIR80800.1 hypothetical protein M8PIadj_0782 [Bifidobacterium animalis]CDL71614.1 putative uncharacterized protein [Bifidobacterium animalis subsp. lactis CECT 8145]
MESRSLRGWRRYGTSWDFLGWVASMAGSQTQDGEIVDAAVAADAA